MGNDIFSQCPVFVAISCVVWYDSCGRYPKELYHGIHHYNKILDSYREMAVPRGRHI